MPFVFRHAVPLLIAGASFVSLAGCERSVPDVPPGAPAEAEAAAVAVDSLRLVQEPSGVRFVSGVVRNAGAEARAVQLTLTLYDGTNRPVTDLFVRVERVEAGAEARFRELVDAPSEVAGVSVRQVLTF